MPAATARAPSKEKLTGAQKSAVLCIALGPKGAARLLQHLSQEEVEVVGREIAALQAVEPGLVNSVLREFESAASVAEPSARGGLPYAQAVLEEALGARAKPVLYKIREHSAGGFTQLRKAPSEVLAGLIRGEHPQVIALILAHLDARHASGIVEEMEPTLAAEVLYRMGRMEKTSPDMLSLIEEALSSKADVTFSQEMTLSGGPGAVAKVLNRIAGPLDKQLLQTITQQDADLGAQITARMFVFEDLLLLDGKAMQRVLREVDAKQLALASKAASAELMQHIKTNMSERAAAALNDEIELLGPVRVRDVEAAQTKILESVRSLEEAGEILLRRPGGNDDIIA
jgi:flagellar motor switch protein FliG